MGAFAECQHCGYLTGDKPYKLETCPRCGSTRIYVEDAEKEPYDDEDQDNPQESRGLAEPEG